MFFNFFVNEKFALIILFSTLFATYAYYFFATELFKVKKSKIFSITVGVFFALFLFVFDYTFVSFYGRSGTFFNISQSICQAIPKAGFVLFICKAFQVLCGEYSMKKLTPKGIGASLIIVLVLGAFLYPRISYERTKYYTHKTFSGIDVANLTVHDVSGALVSDDLTAEIKNKLLKKDFVKVFDLMFLHDVSLLVQEKEAASESSINISATVHFEKYIPHRKKSAKGDYEQAWFTIMNASYTENKDGTLTALNNLSQTVSGFWGAGCQMNSSYGGGHNYSNGNKSISFSSSHRPDVIYYVEGVKALERSYTHTSARHEVG